MVTNSRMTLRLPITSRVRSPPNLRSCGISPTDAIGKISLASPISVQPSITDDAPMRQSRPIETCSPIVAYGPTTGAARRSCASGWTIAVGWIVTPGASVGRDHRTGRAAAPPRRRCGRRDRRCRGRARDSSAARPSAHFQAQPIAGHDLAGGTWRCRRRAGRPWPPSPAASCISSTVATCASVSIIRTPGISGSPGKCPWKKSSFTVTFLTATMRRPGSSSVTASTSGDGYR